MVVVVLRLSVVSRGQAIGVLATKGIPLRIAADREKGRASWRQAGLPAQSQYAEFVAEGVLVGKGKMDGSGRAQVCTCYVCACCGDANAHMLALTLVGH